LKCSGGISGASVGMGFVIIVILIVVGLVGFILSLILLIGANKVSLPWKWNLFLPSILKIIWLLIFFFTEKTKPLFDLVCDQQYPSSCLYFTFWMEYNQRRVFFTIRFQGGVNFTANLFLVGGVVLLWRIEIGPLLLLSRTIFQQPCLLSKIHPIRQQGTTQVYKQSRITKWAN